MSYTYEHRKHPRAKGKAPLPMDTAYNSAVTTPQIPNRVMPETPSSFNLDEAMQARMTRTFGDLSAVKNYTPPAQTQEPVRTEVYTGPVTRAISDAAPSPSVAGPMQAKRSWFGKKKKPPITKKETDLDDKDSIIKYEPPSEYAGDFELLNSQKGSDEERKRAYNNIALPTAKNMTDGQRKDISDFIGNSSMVNTYLRDQKSSVFYPGKKDIPGVIDQIQNISQAIQNNPLPEKLTTYRGTTDRFLALLLQQNGLKKAVNRDGSINHSWLNKNQKKLRKNLVGKTFHEKAFTSTSTEKSFAQFWSRKSALQEKRIEMLGNGQFDEYTSMEKQLQEHPEQTPGAHLITMNLLKGTKGAFIDRTNDDLVHGGQTNQREVLLDKGNMFKISDIRKMENADSYELVMDLLAEEDGVKKGKKKKKK